VPDPSGSNNPLLVQVRRVSLRHSDNEWNGFGLVFLPERLGRAARLAVQIQGDLDRPASWSGGLRFDGMRLAFAGWREVLNHYPKFARSLPAAGNGDLALQLTLEDGHVAKASGDIKANDIMFGTPPWVDPAVASNVANGTLTLDYLSGEWRYLRRRDGGQMQVEQLALSRESKTQSVRNASVEFSGAHVHGSVTQIPLRTIAAVAQWLTPDLLPDGVELQGAADDLDFDWNPARVAGERLAASARVDDAGLMAASGRFALTGLHTRLLGSESRVLLELASPAAKLQSNVLAAGSLDALKLASAVQITRGESGWQVATDRLTVEHDAAQLELSGVLHPGDEGEPVLEVEGNVARADVVKIRDIWPEDAQHVLGPAFARLRAGHIEDAKFSWKGRLDDEDAAERNGDAFRGSLTLRDARIAADGAWPETHAVDARIEWAGAVIRASLDEGMAGPFDLEGVEAQWDANGAQASHVAGRARARIERALAWVRAHPDVQEHVPHLQDLAARGDALFDFDVSIPRRTTPAPKGTPPKTRARVAAFLDGVQLALAPQFPPVEALRGTLAFDNGRLQRSTLSATWLGGPVALKVVERRDRLDSGIAVQAQGFIDAGKVVALSELQRLPEVSGETSWSGELFYAPPSESQPARWQGHVDSNLVGVASDLPAPLAKLTAASVPLHVELTGSGETSEVRANLADRIRSHFALTLDDGGTWQIDDGGIRIATISATTGARQYLNATLQANAEAPGTELRVESDSYGLITGTLLSAPSGIAVKDVKWSRDTLSGAGAMHCEVGLASCDATFNVTTDSLARALADLGFRPDVAASKGTLSGQLKWQPRAEGTWLETASGQVTLRLEDGIARRAVSAAGRPFPLLTVPALLSGMTSDEMRFRSVEAEFELRDGEAHTSNLHFDGDAEILMRGRTGLIAHDYDYEAWVLRGEERIPNSLRRLAATPRVAAAWMALRDLIGGDATERSRVVLHLRGSWSEPVVTVD
jgi:uncharacterized protein YhdP